MNINDITIVIPTSVSPLHPSTEIIDEVIGSVKHSFPDNEIILQIDGLRDEQQHRKEQYDEYKNRILWKCLHEWKNVLPIIFDEHSHQSDMMKATIDLIQTPVMLYLEGDVALRTDISTDWGSALDLLDSGEAYTVRFYSVHTEIPEGHEYLMLGQVGDFTRTFQWSQQPHLSRVSYYRDVVLPNTTPKLFIEDKFYGKVFSDCHGGNMNGWNDHKLWLYTPSNRDSVRVANHLDGRRDMKKFTSDDEAWGLTEA